MPVAHVGNHKPESTNEVNQGLARYAEYLSVEGLVVELWHFTPKVGAWGSYETCLSLPDKVL
jgi:hypothetical protein